MQESEQLQLQTTQETLKAKRELLKGRMSTSEAISTPHTATKDKKRKKGHVTSDPSTTKKRKLASSQQEDAPPPPIPSQKATKKQRKSEKKEQRAIKPEEEQEKVIPDSQPTESQQSQDPPASSKKKRKAKVAPTNTNPTITDDELLRSHSPFTRLATSFYLPLSPCAHAFPLQGLCAEHISPLLLTYYPPLRGVLLSYSNARISEHPTEGVQIHSSTDISSPEAKRVLARSIDEYAVTYVWLTAEFLLFRPERGCWLEGYVGSQSEGFVGVVCYNYFNAVVERARLPEGWRWRGEGKGKRREGEDESGHFVDAEGEKVEGRVVLRVEDFEAQAGGDGSKGMVSIVGSMRRG